MGFQNFDGPNPPVNLEGVGYPTWYMGAYGGGTDGGIFETSIDSSKKIAGASSLKMHFTEGAWLYAQWNPYDGYSKTFARAYSSNPAGWQFNTYNRFRWWIWNPATGESEQTNGTTTFYMGTYVKRVTNPDSSSNEAGGGHYYHPFNIMRNAWSKCTFNMHPGHKRGYPGSVDSGNVPYPTVWSGDPPNTYNYYDALTRWYISGTGGGTGIRDYWIDEIEFYQEPYTENDDQVYGICVSYTAATNRIFLTWNRLKDENSVKHEVRYVFSNIHVLGWDNAIPAPSGIITPPGYQGYNNMVYDTTAIDVTGQSTIYFAIKPQDSSVFSQIALPLNTGIPDTTPPTSPTTLAATSPSQSSISVSWTASTDNVGVTGYIVERCQGTGCSNFTQVGTPTASPFVDSGLTANTFYNYHVRATDAAGNLSGWSNVVGATTQAPDTQAPTAPSNLQTSVVSSSTINLTWTASTDNVAVTNYTVERCTGTSCTTFTQIATPTTNSYSDTNLTASTTYRYRVRATDAANNTSPYSNIASATTPEAPPVSQYLQAGYNFAEGTGTTTQDISGHNHTGTLSGATWSTSGKYGNALTFDGTNDSVGIGTWNIPGSAITLSAWVRADDWKTDDVRILSKATDTSEQGHTWMLSDSNSLLRFRLKTGGTTSTLVATSGTLQTNVWTHVAAVYDGSMMTLYKDGIEVGSQTKTGAIDQNTATITIGMNPDNSNHFDGSIDDVRIYNKALTQTEIQTDMNTPLASGGSGTPTSCNTVTPANFSDTSYNSYGAPFDPFTGNTPLLNVTCTSADTDTINLTTGVTGDTTRIVYTKGYWYDPATTAWRQYAGTCTGALNGEWCQGSVSVTITDPNVSTASSTNPTYLVGMTCSVQGGGWKCGCRDTSCTNFYWQIQGAGQ